MARILYESKMEGMNLQWINTWSAWVCVCVGGGGGGKPIHPLLAAVLDISYFYYYSYFSLSLFCLPAATDVGAAAATADPAIHFVCCLYWGWLNLGFV